MQPLSCAYHSIQLRLIPALDEVVGPLGERDRELVRAFELTAPLLPKVLGPSDYCGLGRPQANRHKLFRAFIAKSVMGFPTTELLIEQLKGNATLRFLCGWDSRGEVPSASTFSRAFAEFAQSGAAAQIHAMLVEATHREKIVGHCSKDSTAIHARERHCRTHDKPLKQKRKRGRRPDTPPSRRPRSRAACNFSRPAPSRRTSATSPRAATGGSRRTARASASSGGATSCIWTFRMPAFRSARSSPPPRCTTARWPCR